MLLAIILVAVYTVAAGPSCTDRSDMVADFADPGLFREKLSSLQTAIRYSGEEFEVFQRVQMPRPWNGLPIPMLHLKPRPSSSLIIELSRPDAAFNSQPDGSPFTSFEFYAIAPEAHAKLHIKLLRHYPDGSEGKPIVWEYDAPDEKMHPVRVWLKGRLTDEATAIEFTDFSSDGNYYIGKIEFVRDCSVADLGYVKSDFQKSVSKSSNSSSSLLWLLPFSLGTLVILAIAAKVIVSRKSKIRALRRGMNDALEKEDDLRLNPWAHGGTANSFNGYTKKVPASA